MRKRRPNLKIAKILVLIVIFALLIWGGLLYEKRAHYQAASETASAFDIRHFGTAINFQSLNEISLPQNEEEWQFELNHLDDAIASEHAAGLDMRRKNSSRPTLPRLSIYGTLLNGEGEPLPQGEAEITDMRDFCVTNGYVNEADFETVFLHYQDPTVANGGMFFPAYDAQNPAPSRIVSSVGYGNFYRFNLKNECVKRYKAHLSEGYVTTGFNGVRYDGQFLDELAGGTMTGAIDEASSGGHILEYGGRTRQEIDSEYAQDQANALAFIRSSVQAVLDAENRQFILWPNTSNERGANQRLVAAGAGAALTETWSSEYQFDSLGDVTAWNYAQAVTGAGGYFVWTENQPEATRSLLGLNAGNYQNAKGTIAAGPAGDGIEARHDMASFVSYLIVNDQNHRTLYQQKAYPLSPPLSTYWMKVREINIGNPKTASYDLWQGVQDDGDGAQNAIKDAAGQPVRIFRRDYDHALVLFRTYRGYPGWFGLQDFNMGTPSALYDLPPNEYGNNRYRLVFPNGSLSEPQTQIALALQEGVILIPDGYPLTSLWTRGEAPQVNLARTVYFNDHFTLTGTKPQGATKIYINNVEEAVDSTGNFSADLPLSLNIDRALKKTAPNIFTVAAEDATGGRTYTTLNIYRHRPGDANGDTDINIFDFAALMQNWNAVRHGAADADFNENDLARDIFDFAVIMKYWNT